MIDTINCFTGTVIYSFVSAGAHINMLNQTIKSFIIIHLRHISLERMSISINFPQNDVI